MRRLAKEDDPMTNTVKLLIDGIAYTMNLQEKPVIETFALQGPMALKLRRFADQEYYAPLPKPLPISGMPTTNIVHAGGLYCYEGFGVFAIPFVDAPSNLYRAVHLGDICEDIVSHLTLADNTVSAKIEIVVT